MLAYQMNANGSTKRQDPPETDEKDVRQAVIAPYLPVYLKHLGITTLQIGIIFGLKSFIGFLVNPLCGILSDRLRQHKLVLMLCIILSAMLMISCRFIHVPTSVQRYKEENDKNEIVCTWNQSELKFTFTKQNCNGSEHAMNTIYINDSDCKIYVIDQKDVCYNTSSAIFFLEYNYNWTRNGNVLHCNYTDSESNNTSQVTCENVHLVNNSSFHAQCYGNDVVSLTFWFCLVILQLEAVFACSVQPLIDMIVYEHLGDKHGDYGKQRVWGAIGRGCFALMSGIFVDAFSNNFSSTSYKNYDPAFVLFAVLVAVTVVITSIIDVPAINKPQKMFNNICDLFRQTEVVASFTAFTVFGIGVGTIQTTFFWFLEEAGAPNSLMGISLLVTCISELPFFFYSGNIIDYLGYRGVIYFVFLSNIIRYLAYSCISNHVWYVLPLEVVHGVVYGAMYATMTSYASIISPPGMSATAQSMVQACFKGLGKICLSYKITV
ncbi:major facilitator superfamily domain-containing protein 6-like [Saccoglossus kowalevskii]